MTTMTRQQRRAAERAAEKGQTVLAEPKTLTLEESVKTVTSKNNLEVLEMLKEPSNGFYVQHQWRVDGSRYTVFAPAMLEDDPNYVDPDTCGDKLRERHLNAYVKAFGGVEAMAYNTYMSGEYAGKNNPFSGEQTYEPFDGGAYKLCFGVIEHDYSDNTYTGRNGEPFLKVAIIPLLQHDWQPDEPRAFGRAYGDSVMLNNLHSMVVRSNFSTYYTSSFNEVRFKNLESMLRQPFTRFSEASALNWLNQYEESLWMGQSLYSDGVETLVGDDVTVGAVDIYRVFD